MNCQGVCQDDYEGESLCNGQCLSLNKACEGKCTRGNDQIDCAGFCSISPLHEMCGDECISIETPCNGECSGSSSLNCNGVCRSIKLQCNGECIHDTYTGRNCDGTCSDDEPNTWICDSECQKKEIPCHGQCAPGFVLIS